MSVLRSPQQGTQRDSQGAHFCSCILRVRLTSVVINDKEQGPLRESPEARIQTTCRCCSIVNGDLTGTGHTVPGSRGMEEVSAASA